MVNTLPINNQLLLPEWSGESQEHQFGGLLKLHQLSYQQLKEGRGLADHAEATIILTVLHQVLSEVHAGVLRPSPEPRTAGPLLGAECHVIVAPLGPDDQGLLLLLVCGVRLDLGLEQRVGDEWRDNLALHSEHLQNPIMDENGELHTCHRTSHIEESRIPPP